MLITVATFNDPLEAHIICGRLQADGIECFLADENIVQANWLYANAVGGVKLKVLQEDVEAAMAVLEEVRAVDATDGSVGEPERHDVATCPECSSSNVSYQKYHKRFAFASWLVLGFPIPWKKNRWICDDCGEEFHSKGSRLHE